MIMYSIVCIRLQDANIQTDTMMHYEPMESELMI